VATGLAASAVINEQNSLWGKRWYRYTQIADIGEADEGLTKYTRNTGFLPSGVTRGDKGAQFPGQRITESLWGR